MGTPAENKEIFTEKEWEIILGELSLSPRQKEVIRHLFCCLSDKQIAAKLNISVPTVRTHIGRLFSRFHLQDRNELIIRIFRQFRQGCPFHNHQCEHWHHKIESTDSGKSDLTRPKADCISSNQKTKE